MLTEVLCIFPVVPRGGGGGFGSISAVELPRLAPAVALVVRLLCGEWIMNRRWIGEAPSGGLTKTKAAAATTNGSSTMWGGWPPALSDLAPRPRASEKRARRSEAIYIFALRAGL
jgi:hypothetical protein